MKKKRPFKKYNNGKTKSRGGRPSKMRFKNVKIKPYISEKPDIFRKISN